MPLPIPSSSRQFSSSSRPWSSAAASSSGPFFAGASSYRRRPPPPSPKAQKKAAVSRKSAAAPYKSLFLQEAQQRAIERSARELQQLRQSRRKAKNEWDVPDVVAPAAARATTPPAQHDDMTKRPAARIDASPQTRPAFAPHNRDHRHNPHSIAKTTVSGHWIRHSSTQVGQGGGAGEIGVPVRRHVFPIQEGPCTSRALSPINQAIVARLLAEAAGATQGEQKQAPPPTVVNKPTSPVPLPKKARQHIRLRYYYAADKRGEVHNPIPLPAPHHHHGHHHQASPYLDGESEADTASLVSAFSQGFQSLCYSHCEDMDSSSAFFPTTTRGDGGHRKLLDISLSPRQRAELQRYRRQQQQQAHSGADMQKVATRMADDIAEELVDEAGNELEDILKEYAEDVFAWL